ncbi:MAG: fused MFS/spermidine synthase [Planctomycetota bacterium]
MKAGVFLSGLAALAYEVFWSRMLGTVLGSSMYSFTLTLAIFLCGIAVGSAVYARFLAGARRQTVVFAAVELGIGALAYLTPYALLWAPLGATAGLPAILRSAALMAGPAILMGAALPCAVQIHRRGTGHAGIGAGGSVGEMYAASSVGSALGPVAAGFVVMPLLGIQRGLVAFAALNAFAGVAVLWDRETRRARRIAYAGASVAVLAAVALFGPTTLFRHLYEESEPQADVVLYREGTAANVVVYDFHRAGYRDLFLNASEEASTRLWHVQLFRMLGALPAIVHGDAEDAVMIAFGAGISAGACVDLVDSFECVELNPDVREVAEIFKRENRDVFSNPGLKLIVNDGRNHLLLSDRRYSLIVSDATNPVSFDAWTLYTKEFYELCRARLAGGGVFCQWVPIHLPGDAVETVLKTFTSVFPHASVWSVYGSTQCLMLATPERLDIDCAELRRRLPSLLKRSGLADCGIDSPEKLLSFFLVGEDGLKAMLDGFDKVNTDNLPHTQFMTGLDEKGVRSSVELLRWQEDVLAYASNADAMAADARARLRAYGSISRMLNLGFLLADDHEFSKAAALASHAGLDDGNVKNALGYDRMRKEYFVNRCATHPDDANAHRALGFILWKEGDHAGALRELERAVELKADYADAHLLMALVHIDARRPDRATRKLIELRELNPTRDVLALVPRALRIVHLQRKLGHEPDDPRLNAMLAEAYMEFGWLETAFETARAAVERSRGDVRMLGLLAGVYESLDLADEALAACRALADAFPADGGLAARLKEFEEIAGDEGARRRWMAAKVPSSDGAPRGAADPDGPEADYRRAIGTWNEHDALGKVEPKTLERAAKAMAGLARAGARDARISEDAAVLHELLGRHDEAASFWRLSAEASPSDRVPGNNVKRLKLLIQLRGADLPKDEAAEVHNKVGGLHWQNGEIERAIRSFEQALADDPRHAVALANIGMCYIASGRYEDAVTALERGLAVGRDESYASEVGHRLRWLRRVLGQEAR